MRTATCPTHRLAITALGCAALAICLTLAIPAQASSFYKWVDENGVTHYTAQPPEDRPSQQVNVRTGKTRVNGEDSPQDEGPTLPTGEDEAENEDLEQELAKEKERIEQQNQENCEIARRNQFNLKHRDRIRITDEDTGEERYLTPEELEEWRERTDEEIDEYCN